MNSVLYFCVDSVCLFIMVHILLYCLFTYLSPFVFIERVMFTSISQSAIPPSHSSYISKSNLYSHTLNAWNISFNQLLNRIIFSLHIHVGSMHGFEPFRMTLELNLRLLCYEEL